MKKSDTSRLDWKDFLFGLIGSSIIVVIIQMFTGS